MMSEQIRIDDERIGATESAIQQVRKVVAELTDSEKEFLRSNSVGYRQLYHSFRADLRDALTTAQSEAVAANQQVLVLATANEKLMERVGELADLLNRAFVYIPEHQFFLRENIGKAIGNE